MYPKFIVSDSFRQKSLYSEGNELTGVHCTWQVFNSRDVVIKGTNLGNYEKHFNIGCQWNMPGTWKVVKVINKNVIILAITLGAGVLLDGSPENCSESNKTPNKPGLPFSNVSCVGIQPWSSVTGDPCWNPSMVFQVRTTV